MLRNPGYEGHQRALSLSSRGEYLNVADCRKCGHAFAWAKSKRTGKWYPCTVVAKRDMEYGSNRDVLRAEPWRPHECEEPTTVKKALAWALDEYGPEQVYADGERDSKQAEAWAWERYRIREQAQ